MLIAVASGHELQPLFDMALREQYGSAKNCNGITRKHCSNTHDGYIFDERLSNDEAVERIFMMWRQMLECQYMPKVDWQKLNIVDPLLAFNNFRQRPIEIKLAELRFDLHLLHACDAQNRRIAVILA
jgi:hypothetical protein